MKAILPMVLLAAACAAGPATPLSQPQARPGDAAPLGSGPNVPASGVSRPPVESSRGQASDAGVAPACRVATKTDALTTLGTACRAACRAEPGLASKVRVRMDPPGFKSGETIKVKVTVENTTDADVRLPLRWPHGYDLEHPRWARFRPAGGDLADFGCMDLGVEDECADIVLAPHASASWAVTAMALERPPMPCGPQGQRPLAPGRYVLHVDAPADTDRALVGEATVTVSR